MNIDAVHNWPLVLIPRPREKVLQNDFSAPIPPQDQTNRAILNNVSVIETKEFWAKGSFIDIYI